MVFPLTMNACRAMSIIGGAVGYGDVVLRIQGVVALFARLDDDVRFGFAMPDYV